MSINKKEFLSVKEFAQLLNVHTNTIRNAIKCGRINAFKIGSGKRSMFRISRSEIERMALFDLKKYMEKQ